MYQENITNLKLLLKKRVDFISYVYGPRTINNIYENYTGFKFDHLFKTEMALYFKKNTQYQTAREIVNLYINKFFPMVKWNAMTREITWSYNPKKDKVEEIAIDQWNFKIERSSFMDMLYSSLRNHEEKDWKKNFEIEKSVRRVGIKIHLAFEAFLTENLFNEEKKRNSLAGVSISDKPIAEETRSIPPKETKKVFSGLSKQKEPDSVEKGKLNQLVNDLMPGIITELKEEQKNQSLKNANGFFRRPVIGDIQLVAHRRAMKEAKKILGIK